MNIPPDPDSRPDHAAAPRPEPEAVEMIGPERVIRVGHGKAVPECYRVKQWLGVEEGIVYGSYSGYKADVLLVEEVRRV